MAIERETVWEVLQEGERLAKVRKDGECEEESWRQWLWRNGAVVLNVAISLKRLRREE